jgi:hypothetical protein
MWRQKGFADKRISELESTRATNRSAACQVTSTSDLFALCGMRAHIRHAMLRFGRAGTEKPQRTPLMRTNRSAGRFARNR